MTKDAAGAFREALSAESISCLMLTSDNGVAEDVFVYRASYS